MAILPDAENPGANVLKLLRPEGVIGGHDDDCLCSVGLPAEKDQTASELQWSPVALKQRRQLFRFFKKEVCK